MQAIMSLYHFWQSGTSGWVWRQTSQTDSLFLMHVCPSDIHSIFNVSFNLNCIYLYCSSTPLEIFDSDSLKAPPIKAFKSRAQRFEDVPGILREGRLSPFDLMVELLDDSNLKY